MLGGKSQVLDLGRKRRYYTDAQRIAMLLRDGGCTTEGCDRTTGLTHAHHDTRWTDGGNTDLDNGRLLCRWHHAKAHDTHYDIPVHQWVEANVTTNPAARSTKR